jgi:hypothetical protein
LSFKEALQEEALVKRLDHREYSLNGVELWAVRYIEHWRQLQFIIGLSRKQRVMDPHVIHKDGDRSLWKFISQL